MTEIPTKPYLLRALYEWCVDNGYTPHITVKVDARTQVPPEHVREGEITLNVAPAAVNGMQMGNERIEFTARFGGVARQIIVPVDAVRALYARETGQGMGFEALAQAPQAPVEVPDAAAAERTEPPRPAGGRPELRRVK